MSERYPEQIFIRVSEELKDKLKEDATRIDRNVSYVARRILEKHYGLNTSKDLLFEN
jgi:predicted DNA-binding protein